MSKLRGGAAALALLLTLAFVASAQAVTPTNFTTSNVSSPADGTLLLLNQQTNPTQTFTVSGTTNGGSGDAVDIDCYFNGTEQFAYKGSGTGFPVANDGSFTADVPLSEFAGQACELLAVPHNTTPTPGTSYLGPRVGISEFQTFPGPGSSGPAYDYNFADVTTRANSGSNSIDDCGPWGVLLDGTSALNYGNYLFNCGGSFYASASDRINSTTDLTRSEIEVDGQNAYGSYAANYLFSGSAALAGFPALSASLDSFDSATGNAQTTESEPLVKCSPEDVYAPTASTCTAFASTGVAIKRVTDYTNSGRVVTVTDTFTSTDGQAHSLDLQYETDLSGGQASPSSAGFELPGQSSFSYTSGYSGPAAATAPGTVYAIDDTTSAPSLNNPVGAATFSVPYHAVTYDDTIWGPAYPSALFDYQPMVPAGGSTSITWSYATGASLTEVQGYAAAASEAIYQTEDASQPPAIAISGPPDSASSPVTVYGTASAGSGVKSVVVDGVTATVSGDNWTASVPLSNVDAGNIVTATLTSEAGNTATATRNVSYTPPSKVKLEHVSFNGSAVLVKLACEPIGGNCRGSVRDLRYTKTVVKHHRKHTTTVFIASKKRYAILTGRTGTVRVGLNGAGKRLLKARGKLNVKGLVTVTQRGGQTQPVASFRLTLKQPKKHHK